MTKEELQDLFGEKRCKPEPVEPCEDSKHGCCPDNFHSAKGPFFEGNLSIYKPNFRPFKLSCLSKLKCII